MTEPTMLAVQPSATKKKKNRTSKTRQYTEGRRKMDGIQSPKEASGPSDYLYRWATGARKSVQPQ